MDSVLAVLFLVVFIGASVTFLGGCSYGALSSGTTAEAVVIPPMSDEFKEALSLGFDDSTLQGRIDLLTRGIEEKNCPWCMGAMSEVYVDEMDYVRENINQALKLAEQAHNANVPIGSFMLGMMYLDPSYYNIPKDAEKGVMYFDYAISFAKNAQKNDDEMVNTFVKLEGAESAMTLADYYYSGTKTLAKNRGKAYKYYKIARNLDIKTVNEIKGDRAEARIALIRRAADYEMEPTELLKAYKSSKTTADKKYAGKSVRLTGTIREIVTDDAENMYITFVMWGNQSMNNVQCFFEKEHADELAQLQVNQHVIVQGTVEGFTENVVLRKCFFVPEDVPTDNDYGESEPEYTDEYSDEYSEGEGEYSDGGDGSY